MARLVLRTTDPPHPCPYLPEEQASLDHLILVDVSPEEYDALLSRGYRRFGPDFFRPKCASCSACVSTRIVLEDFHPNKSQRRARQACADLRISIGPPKVDEARLELYARWHGSREKSRGWSPSQLDEDRYAQQFVFPHAGALEIAYHDEAGRLVGLALSDETPTAWTAIYFFYDPAWARRSIGTGNVVIQAELARARGCRYLYLGYRVSACPSLRYKERFHIQETLEGLPSLAEEPRWHRVEPEA
jgi:arginyl-tRNA--protein-N-Asp/Glu arginylyltransferase